MAESPFTINYNAQSDEDKNEKEMFAETARDTIEMWGWYAFILVCGILLAMVSIRLYQGKSEKKKKTK